MLTLKNFDKVLVSYLYEPDTYTAKVVYVSVPVIEGQADTGKMMPRAILETVKGKRKGVVVAIGAGQIGWSMCNTKPGWSRKEGWHEGDVFDREKGLSLALKRADIASRLNRWERESFYTKVPDSIIDLFEEMDFRAQLYFPEEVEDDNDYDDDDDSLPF